MFPPVTADVPKDPRDLVDRPAEVRPAEIFDQLRVWTGQLTDRFDALVEVAQTTVERVTEQLNPPLTDEQREAAQLVFDMLAPNKLGGADRRFGYEDVDAVAAGITDGGFKGVIARRVAPAKLRAGLAAAGVERDEDAAADATERNLSLDELDAFKAAGETLAERSAALERLGLRVVFPDGISQAALRHILDERPGLPPGGTLVRIDPEG
jgi:hypothetical protein